MAASYLVLFPHILTFPFPFPRLSRTLFLAVVLRHPPFTCTGPCPEASVSVSVSACTIACTAMPSNSLAAKHHPPAALGGQMCSRKYSRRQTRVPQVREVLRQSGMAGVFPEQEVQARPTSSPTLVSCTTSPTHSPVLARRTHLPEHSRAGGGVLLHASAWSLRLSSSSLASSPHPYNTWRCTCTLESLRNHPSLVAHPFATQSPATSLKTVPEWGFWNDKGLPL